MKNLKFILPILCLIGFSACEEEPIINPDGFIEVVPKIEGTWKINQVFQNGNDVTSLLDFSFFSLELNYDNGQPSSFVLSDFNTPFSLKSASGNWSFDDPTYPKRISFSDGTVLDFNGPVLSGKTEIVLSVPIGCGTNSYVYRLIK